MKRFTKNLYLLFFFVSALSMSAQPYNFSPLDILLQDSLSSIGGTATEDFGGLTLMIWRDGKVVYDKSFALPGKNMSKTRILPIASASKWMSGSVITSMIDRGQIRLDDSVAQYIPGTTGSARRADRKSTRLNSSH